MSFSLRGERKDCRQCLLLLPLALVLNMWSSNRIPDPTHGLVAVSCLTSSFFSLIWTQTYFESAVKYKNNAVVSGLQFSAVFTLVAKWLSLTNLTLVPAAVGFCVGFVFVKGLKEMPTRFPGSFTYCELVVVLQGSLSFLSISLGCLLSRLFEAQPGFCSASPSSLTLQILFIGLIATLALIYSHSRPSHGQTYFILTLGIALTYILLWHLLKIEPLFWLCKFLTSSTNRITLMMTWFGLLLLSTWFAIVWHKLIRKKASTVVRKFFHVVIVAAFAIGLRMDPSFLSFSCSCLLLIFILLEVLRNLRLPPLGAMIEACFDTFRDEKDEGPLTLTHIYLLVGCALPLWLHSGDHLGLNLFALSSASGVIAIGFGDTAAAVFGSLLGSHHWANSRKTLEGTASAVVAQVAGSIWLCVYLGAAYPNGVQLLGIVLVSTLVGLIEAKTNQVDNLVLPLYHNLLNITLALIL